MKHVNWKVTGLILIVALSMVTGRAFALSENLIIHYIDSTVNEDGDTFTIDILLSALDEQQQPVADLSTRDFEVEEDSVSVELDTVEMMRDLPINVILVMDVSGSMQGQRLSSAKLAISEFIKSLYRGDKVAIYTFNSETREIVSLTEDLNHARDTFENAEIYAGGGTCLFDATYAAAQIASELPAGRQAVVVLSDGWDTNNGSDTCSTYTVEDIIGLATGQDFNIPVYTIGIGTDIDRDSLGEISAQTGGLFTESTVNADLPQLFEQLANRLSSQYKLTYTSQNAPGDHQLAVTFDGNTVEKLFTLPGLPPVISIAYPEVGQILEQGVNTIKLSLAERGIPIDTLTFQINGVSIGVGGKVGQPPYEYDIDFSQYEGQVVDMTILALNTQGEVLSETTTQMNLTGEEITVADQTGTEEATSAVSTTSNSCPDGSVCLGSLELTRNQIIIVGGVILALVVGVVLIVFFSKKQKPEKNDNPVKDSLFEGATMDGLAYPVSEMGRLTILASDDPLMNSKEFQLTKSPTTIGRSVNNDIALPKDSAVSRKHIQIIDKGGKIVMDEIMKTLSDGTQQPPTYGTYINDRKVTGQTTLNTGDVIGLGSRTKLRYIGPEKPSSESESEDVTSDQWEAPNLGEIDDSTRDG
jgi:VWFA-related protein